MSSLIFRTVQLCDWLSQGPKLRSLIKSNNFPVLQYHFPFLELCHKTFPFLNFVTVIFPEEKPTCWNQNLVVCYLCHLCLASMTINVQHLAPTWGFGLRGAPITICSTKDDFSSPCKNTALAVRFMSCEFDTNTEEKDDWTHLLSIVEPDNLKPSMMTQRVPEQTTSLQWAWFSSRCWTI